MGWLDLLSEVDEFGTHAPERDLPKLTKPGFVSFGSAQSGERTPNQTLARADAWFLYFADREPLEVHFFPGATRTEALAVYPNAVAAEAISLPAPTTSCNDCAHRRRPGPTETGYCAQRTDLPRAYGDHHPLRSLPEDGGVACTSWQPKQ